MSEVINVYCDESCHLENDHQPIMVLGALWSPFDRVDEINRRIREIKIQHHLAPSFETKWTKVSPSQKLFYLDLLDYFFDDDDLHFRGLIAADKQKLRHAAYGQDHNTWYYKMYFELLKVLLSPMNRYRIFVDIKDTHTAVRVAKLHDVLSNNMYDFRRSIIALIQPVRSHEVQMIQLADLLVGAVSYANRDLATSTAKTALVDRMRERSGYTLHQTTLLREEKVNIFRWEPTVEQA